MESTYKKYQEVVLLSHITIALSFLQSFM